MTLVFHLKEAFQARSLDFRSVVWDSLRSTSLDVFLESQVRVERTSFSIKELFDVEATDVSKTDAKSGKPNESTTCDDSLSYDFELRGDFTNATGIGWGVEQSSIRILGNAGEQLSYGQKGGLVSVVGDAGDYTAQGMRGGTLSVQGNCGKHLAAPMLGERGGLRGGEIFISGDVGDRPALRMRRGTILVGGDCGDRGCNDMIAGTFVALGNLGCGWCEGMRRGTLVIDKSGRLQTEAHLSAGYLVSLNILPLLWRHLSFVISHLGLAHDFDRIRSLTERPSKNESRVYRLIGDLRVQGLGEILALDEAGE